MAELFWVFFRIGLISFGGGYAMVPLFEQEITKRGWLGIEAIIDFIAVSYSTPGPFSVNLATFVGSSQAGYVGAAVSTLGIILPSFAILTIVSKIYSSMKKSYLSEYALKALHASVIALVAAAAWSAIKLAMVGENATIDYKSAIIFVIVGCVQLFFKKISPMYIIGIGCVLGIMLYGFI